MLFQSRIALRFLGNEAITAGFKCSSRSQVMKLSSVALAFDDYNSKTTSSASPILLSHGMLGSRSNWTSIAKQIHKSTGRRVVAADARNHGDSPHTDKMCYASMAKDLERLISELQLGPVSLVGHRWIFTSDKFGTIFNWGLSAWGAGQPCNLPLLPASLLTKLLLLMCPQSTR